MAAHGVCPVCTVGTDLRHACPPELGFWPQLCVIPVNQTMLLMSLHDRKEHVSDSRVHFVGLELLIIVKYNQVVLYFSKYFIIWSVALWQCWGIRKNPPILTSLRGFLPVRFPDLAQFSRIRLARPDEILELSFFPLFELNSHNSVCPGISETVWCQTLAIGDTFGEQSCLLAVRELIHSCK